MSFLRQTRRTSSGNEYVPIVDSADAYQGLLDVIRAAKRFIYIASWGFDPTLELTRTGSNDPTLGDLLLQRARDGLEVKVLAWDYLSAVHQLGTLGDVFRKDLRDFKQALAAAGSKAGKGSALFLTKNPVRPPRRSFATGSDHQKFWIADEAGGHPVAFVGGINLSPHEWDTSEHKLGDRRRTTPGLNRDGLALQDALNQPALAALARMKVEQELENRFQLSTWLDSLNVSPADKARRKAQAVDMAIAYLKTQKPAPARHDVTGKIRGPAVTEVLEEFRTRWKLSGSGALLEGKTSIPARSSGIRLQVGHTAHYPKPGGKQDIWRSYIHALKQAERFIYLENQYFTAPSVRNALIERLKRRRELQVVVVLPGEPEEPFLGPAITQRQAQTVRMIEAAASKVTPRTRRFHALALSKWNASANAYEGIYVHAKVAIIDDNWMTIGSANTFSRSFEYDTELNVFTDDVKHVVALRRRLWSEHLEIDPADEILKDPLRAIKRIVETVEANAKLKAGNLTGRLIPMKFQLPPFWLRPLYDQLANEAL